MTVNSPAVATLAALTVGLLVAGGGWLLVAGFLTEPGQPSHRRRRSKIPHAMAVRLGAGLVGGMVLALLTGWLVWLMIVPMAMAVLPRLLATGVDPEVELLAALDRWVRFLAASLGTGKSVTDAVRLSARVAPPLLARPLGTLTVRLDERWAPREALRAMADELDSSQADAVIAALILACERGGVGVTASMDELSEVLQRRLLVLREIGAERAKPRIVTRQVSIVMGVVITVALLAGRDFFAPYGTAVGQLILAVLIGGYLASLAMLRRLSTGRRRTRILQGTS